MTDHRRVPIARNLVGVMAMAMLGVAAMWQVDSSRLPAAAPLAHASADIAQSHRADLIDDIIDTINGILGGGSGSGSSGSGGSKP